MATIVHDKDLICPDCGLEFRRLDHLKRHTALHNGRKPFACSACGRSFSRRDTLQRHVAVHQPSDTAVSPQAISATDRSEAACSHCRASKQKCDGIQPCNRCTKKGVECAYLPRRMRQVKKLHIRPDPESSSTESETQDLIGGDANAASLTLSHVSLQESTSPSLFRPTPASTATPADIRQLWQELLSQAPVPSTLPIQGIDAIMSDLLNVSHEQGSFLDLTPWSPTTDGGFLAPDATWPAAPALPAPSPGEGILRIPNVPSLSSQEQAAIAVDIDVGVDAENYGHVPSLSLPKYESIVHWALVLLPGVVLPAVEPFSAFIQLYFERFHDLIPILHRPTFDPNTASDTLVLAIAHVQRCPPIKQIKSSTSIC
ncbi:hypothetical protein CSOJ01_11245 [Colletotrichum sojae]|uniref:Uncharacterized protein n=1 Tax=Colletotrichum sojae TaxID=2175907 RepID=A0A8H6IYP1_9PEZI|nr:hypothetical protein CSOJ01_11245 [Colletotrichum sojae]